MTRTQLRKIVCAAAAGTFLIQQTAMATGYTWANPAAGGAWNATANWGVGGGYPSANGDVANLNLDFTVASTITATAGSPRIGILNWGDTTTPFVAVTIGASNGSGSITFNNSGTGAQLNHIAGGPTTDNFRANIVLEDNLTVNVASATYAAKLWGGVTETGGPFGITKTGAGYLYIEPAANPVSYTGLTRLQAGRIQVAGNGGRVAIPGNVLVTGGRLQNTGTEAIADTANIEFQAGDWNVGGASETIGSLTSTTAGNIFSAVTFGLAATSGTYSYGGIISATNFSKTGGSTQTLAGTAANVFANVSVTGGTLQLNKTAGTDALSGAIAIGDSAGTDVVRLLAANQINNAAILTLNGGTIDLNGLSDAVTTPLTSSGASTIDAGAGAAVMAFGNSSAQTWGGSLQVLNWSGTTAGGGTDQLIFGADATGLTAGQLGVITFINPTSYAPGTYPATILSTGEIVPVVPEPAGLGLVALGGLLLLRRKRQT